MDIDWFIREYFVNPMAQPDKYAPYNVYNTVAYAVLALVAAWLIFRGLKRAGIEIDKSFFFAISPFVVFGSAIRVVTDAEMLPRSVMIAGQTIYPFITPGIYVLTFAVVIAGISSALWLDGRAGKKAVWWLGAIGCVLAAAAIVPLLSLFQFFLHGALILIMGLAGAGVLKAWEKLKKGKVRFSAQELFTAFAQCLDGAATFVGVGIGTPATSYGEQHVVGNLIIDAFGSPLGFYFLKLAFVLVVIYVLRRELSEKKAGDAEEKNYILLLVTILGLAPGVRDALRIVAGV